MTERTRIHPSKYFGIITVSFVCLFAPNAFGNILMGGMVGYGTGLLSHSKETTNISGVTYQGYLGYTYNNTLSLYGFSQNVDLSYSQADAKHGGIYQVWGPGIGLHLFGAKARWFTIMLQYGLSGTYTTIAESKATINDFSYRSSNHTKLEGTGAIQAMFGYESLSYASRDHYLFYGIYGGVINQTFTKKTTSISSNSDNIEPVSPGISESSYTVNFLSIMISISYSM